MVSLVQASDTDGRDLAESRNIQIQIETDSDGTITAEIEARLVKALRQNVPPNDSEPLILIARDGTDVVGGLIGSTSYGWLLVKILWVAEEVRRRGLGTCLMAQAEALARGRGCHGAWLDTSTADAEQFYIRLGYKRFGVLENIGSELPHGHRRAFFAKRLTRASSELKDGISLVESRGNDRSESGGR
jgi:predicted N-acetyltransferase YhbS